MDHDYSFESVRLYYKKQTEREPEIKREWVEGYLKVLQSNGTSDRGLVNAWENISLFLSYQTMSQYRDLAQMPFWEYSVCLQWVKDQNPHFKLNIKGATKFLNNLLDFYGYMETNGHIGSIGELTKAMDSMLGFRLRLVDRIPYTGEETWTSVHSPDGPPATFTIKDFWLTMLFVEYGRWERLKEEARKSVQPDRILESIESFRQRLNETGFASPNSLPVEDASYEDLADARRWFYKGKTPAIKWTTI